MAQYVYDVETLPNLLTFIFQNVDSPGELLEFVTFGDRDDREKLGEWYRAEQPEIIGFNNYYFDDFILAQTLLSPRVPVARVYAAAQNLIKRNFNQVPQYAKLQAARERFRSIDLLQVLPFGKGNSLKEIAGKLGLSIAELPVPFDEPISAETLPLLLEYNRNDVRVTLELYNQLLPVIEKRRAIGKGFGVYALRSTESELGVVLLEKLLGGTPEERFVPREFVNLGDILISTLRFDSAELGNLLEDIRGSRVELTGSRVAFSRKLRFGENEYSLGVGGLHSQDEPGVFESSPEIAIVDCDVSSYYPSMMIRYGFFPEHLGERFRELYSAIVQLRLQAKREGDQITADGLKLVVNSVFGRMQYSGFHNWLYDPKSFLSVTINGQLFLLDLIEKLELSGVRVLSANTDGVTVLLPRELESVYSSVCAEWEERSGFTLEYSRYSRYVRRDVNNYLAETETGKLKTKGIFSEDTGLGTAHKTPIIARGLVNYFLSRKPPEETLSEERTLLPFCRVYKPSKSAEMVLQTPQGEEIPLPRVNRFYYAKTGGVLTRIGRIRKNGEEVLRKSVVRKLPVRIVNDELGEEFPEEDIDFGVYLEEIRTEIRKIETLPAAVTQGELRFGSAESGGSNPAILPEEGRSKSAVYNPLSVINPLTGDELEGSIPWGNLLESRYSLEEIREFTGAIEEINGIRLPCPVHDGKSSRSLLISEEEGFLRVYCFGGCEPGEVLREIESRIDSGMEFREPEPEPLGELVCSYEYRDHAGRLVFVKDRYNPKTFRVRGMTAGGLRPGMNGNLPVLYNLGEVLRSEEVFIVEGEKDVQTLLNLGVVGTCNYDGAGKWLERYSRVLTGKTVFILPDNDSPGLDHAELVRTRVLPLAKSVRVVSLPGLAESGDVSDWVQTKRGEGFDSAEIREQLLGIVRAVSPSSRFLSPEDILQTPATDDGKAKLVLALYGDRVRYSPGLGWLWFEGSHWLFGELAESKIRTAITDSFYQVIEAAAKTRSDNHNDIYRKFIPNYRNVGSTLNQLKQYVAVPESEFENPPGLLNVANGVVNLQTGELYPHHPSYGFLYCLGTPYSAEPPCSTAWREFLGETVPEPVLEYLQLAMGYTFTGVSNEEVFLYIYGPKRSGKGTFTETVKTVTSPLGIEVPLATFIESYQSNRFAFSGMESSRFVHASESNHTDWLDNRTMKVLTGGNDIPIEYKNRNRYFIRPQFTVWISSNEPPRMKPEDDAAWYRLDVIEFPFSKAGSEDKRLKSKLLTPEVREEVLYWIVEGSRKWYGLERGLISPPAVRELTEGFRQQLDYIGQFIEEHFERVSPDSMENLEFLRGEGWFVEIETVFELYRQWYETAGASELKKRSLSQKLRANLGGVNRNPLETRVMVPDPVTGSNVRKPAIFGIRPKSNQATEEFSELFRGSSKL